MLKQHLLDRGKRFWAVAAKTIISIEIAVFNANAITEDEIGDAIQ